MKKQYSILFIGNSMTYYHDMPTAIFEKMAASAGFDVTVRSVTAGGRFLWEHLSLDDEAARAALKQAVPTYHDPEAVNAAAQNAKEMAMV